MTSQAYKNFLLALERKSPYTKVSYISALKLFLERQKLALEEFLHLEKIALEDTIKAYIVKIGYSQALKTLGALQTFCDVNRIDVNWGHVRRFMPAEPDREDKYRAYTHEEANKAISEAELREKTAMLCMATGGPRIGGLEGIRIDKDLIWVEQHELYAGIIYPGSRSEYMAFFSPQCSQFIDELKDRRSTGHLFVNKFESDLGVSRKSLYEAIRSVLEKVDLIADDLQPDHSFRKFFRSQLTNAGITKDNARMLMGHGIDKLQKIYDLHHALEHLENTQYHKAIPNLTF